MTAARTGGLSPRHLSGVLTGIHTKDFKVKFPHLALTREKRTWPLFPGFYMFLHQNRHCGLLSVFNCSCSTEEQWAATTPNKDMVLSSPVKWWKIQHEGNFLLVTHFLWLRWGTGSQVGASKAAAVTPHCVTWSALLGCTPLRHLQRGNSTHPQHQHQSASISSEHFHW